jgi:hypothetical protein
VTLALHQRLTELAPSTAQLLAVVGYVRAGLLLASVIVFKYGMGAVVRLYATAPDQAVSAWQAIEPMAEALGGAGGGILDWTDETGVQVFRSFWIRRRILRACRQSHDRGETRILLPSNSARPGRHPYMVGSSISTALRRMEPVAAKVVLPSQYDSKLGVAAGI